MDWMSVSSPNSYVGIYILNMMVVGGVAYGRWLAQESETLMKGISALIRKTSQSPLCPQGKDRKHALTRHQNCSTLIMDFPAFQTVINKSQLYISHLVYGILSKQLKWTDAWSSVCLHESRYISPTLVLILFNWLALYKLVLYHLIP